MDPNTFQQFHGASPTMSLTHVRNTASTTTSHTVSASAVVGELAVLHCSAVGSGGYTGATPSGWTELTYSRTTTGTGAVWGVFAIKILVSGDIGTTLTGLPGGGGGQGSTISYFTPSRPIVSATVVGTAGNEATTGTPVNQSLNIQTNNAPPNLAFAGYISNNAITTRTSTGATMTEITERTVTLYSYVKYKVYNVGSTLENITIAMADYGNNCLQSFYLKVS